MEILGNKKERDLFNIVFHHYTLGTEDLERRFPDWDKKLELFYSYIDEKKWPYNSQIFVPQTFTTLFEKMSRLNAGKPRGRLIPREGGDVIKAKISNALLSYQWDDVVRIDKEPMFAKWARMDLNARLYGASFGLVKWRYELDSKGRVLFDGPTMRVISNKDAIYNPAYSSIRNWFQYRDFPTIQELERVNDVSSVAPRYKNLKLLKEAMAKDGDRRENNYTLKGRSMLGLEDYLGRDEDPRFKTVEIVTELSEDRITVFAPKYGVILRDEPNPYEHGQIPVVQLRYIVVDDDIYGLSDIQPFEKIQKALNALSSQYIDAVNMDLYRILQVRPSGVQMHTLKYGPGEKWMMNNPGSDVVPFETSVAATSKFTDVYSVLTSMLKEAAGETSAAFSTLQPGGGEKTATEIQSLEATKSVRDTFNQNYLSEAIRQQMLLWLSMDQQFIFADPTKEEYLLRIIGRSDMDEFRSMGLGDMAPDTSEGEMFGAEASILAGGEASLREIPVHPVSVGGEVRPKFEMDDTGTMGMLHVTPDDMVGSYDYIVDVEPMRANRSAEEKRIRLETFNMLTNPTVLQLLMQKGKSVNIEEILVDVFESSGAKGADRYFEQGGMNGVNGAGETTMPGGGVAGGLEETPGMGSGGEMAQDQGVPFLG